MTEISVQKGKLPPAVQRFVLHWGEMGATWGTNRSVGQIHALLYLSDQPLAAEDIAETLGLARSNVSNSLKELVAWQLVRRVHVMGDRRDFFAAETDLWEMATRIAEGRKVREIDPTLAMLRTAEAEAAGDRFMSATARERIAAMRGFLELVDGWAGEMRRVPRPRLAALMRLGAAIVRLLPRSGRGNPASPPAASAEPSGTGTTHSPAPDRGET